MQPSLQSRCFLAWQLLHSQRLFMMKANQVMLKSAEKKLLGAQGRAQDTRLHHFLFLKCHLLDRFICIKHRAQSSPHTVGIQYIFTK